MKINIIYYIYNKGPLTILQERRGKRSSYFVRTPQTPPPHPLQKK